MTALVLVSLSGNGCFNVLPHFWIPNDNLSDRSNQESAKYRQWADNGLITLTEGNEVDFAAVRRRLNDLRDKDGLWIEKIGFDPWCARQLSQPHGFIFGEGQRTTNTSFQNPFMQFC